MCVTQNGVVTGSETGELCAWTWQQPSIVLKPLATVEGLALLPAMLMIRNGSTKITALARAFDRKIEFIYAASSEGFVSKWQASGSGVCILSRLALPFAASKLSVYYPPEYGLVDSLTGAGGIDPIETTGVGSTGASSAMLNELAQQQPYLIASSHTSPDVYVLSGANLRLVCVLRHEQQSSDTASSAPEASAGSTASASSGGSGSGRGNSAKGSGRDSDSDSVRIIAHALSPSSHQVMDSRPHALSRLPPAVPPNLQIGLKKRCAGAVGATNLDAEGLAAAAAAQSASQEGNDPDSLPGAAPEAVLATSGVSIGSPLFRERFLFTLTNRGDLSIWDLDRELALALNMAATVAAYPATLAFSVVPALSKLGKDTVSVFPPEGMSESQAAGISATESIRTGLIRTVPSVRIKIASASSASASGSAGAHSMPVALSVSSDGLRLLIVYQHHWSVLFIKDFSVEFHIGTPIPDSHSTSQSAGSQQPALSSHFASATRILYVDRGDAPWIGGSFLASSRRIILYTAHGFAALYRLPPPKGTPGATPANNKLSLFARLAFSALPSVLLTSSLRDQTDAKGEAVAESRSNIAAAAAAAEAASAVSPRHTPASGTTAGRRGAGLPSESPLLSAHRITIPNVPVSTPVSSAAFGQSSSMTALSLSPGLTPNTPASSRLNAGNEEQGRVKEQRVAISDGLAGAVLEYVSQQDGGMMLSLNTGSDITETRNDTHQEYDTNATSPSLQFGPSDLLTFDNAALYISALSEYPDPSPILAQSFMQRSVPSLTVGKLPPTSRSMHPAESAYLSTSLRAANAAAPAVSEAAPSFASFVLLPVGDYIFAGSADGLVATWTIPPSAWLTRARRYEQTKLAPYRPTRLRAEVGSQVVCKLGTSSACASFIPSMLTVLTHVATRHLLRHHILYNQNDKLPKSMQIRKELGTSLNIPAYELSCAAQTYLECVESAVEPNSELLLASVTIIPPMLVADINDSFNVRTNATPSTSGKHSQAVRRPKRNSIEPLDGKAAPQWSPSVTKPIPPTRRPRHRSRGKTADTIESPEDTISSPRDQQSQERDVGTVTVSASSSSAMPARNLSKVLSEIMGAEEDISDSLFPMPAEGCIQSVVLNDTLNCASILVKSYPSGRIVFHDYLLNSPPLVLYHPYFTPPLASGAAISRPYPMYMTPINAIESVTQKCTLLVLYSDLSLVVYVVTPCAATNHSASAVPGTSSASPSFVSPSTPNAGLLVHVDAFYPASTSPIEKVIWKSPFHASPLLTLAPFAQDAHMQAFFSGLFWRMQQQIQGEARTLGMLPTQSANDLAMAAFLASANATMASSAATVAAMNASADPEDRVDSLSESNVQKFAKRLLKARQEFIYQAIFGQSTSAQIAWTAAAAAASAAGSHASDVDKVGSKDEPSFSGELESLVASAAIGAQNTLLALSAGGRVTGAGSGTGPALSLANAALKAGSGPGVRNALLQGSVPADLFSFPKPQKASARTMLSPYYTPPPLFPVYTGCPGDLVYLSCADGSLRIISLRERVELKVLRGHDSPVVDVHRDAWCISQGYLCTQTLSGTIYLWALGTGTLIRVLPSALTQPPAFNPNRRAPNREQAQILSSLERFMHTLPPSAGFGSGPAATKLSAHEFAVVHAFMLSLSSTQQVVKQYRAQLMKQIAAIQQCALNVATTGATRGDALAELNFFPNSLTSSMTATAASPQASPSHSPSPPASSATPSPSPPASPHPISPTGSASAESSSGSAVTSAASASTALGLSASHSEGTPSAAPVDWDTLQRAVPEVAHAASTAMEAVRVGMTALGYGEPDVLLRQPQAGDHHAQPTEQASFADKLSSGRALSETNTLVPEDALLLQSLSNELLNQLAIHVRIPSWLLLMQQLFLIFHSGDNGSVQSVIDALHPDAPEAHLQVLYSVVRDKINSSQSGTASSAQNASDGVSTIRRDPQRLPPLRTCTFHNSQHRAHMSIIAIDAISLFEDLRDYSNALAPLLTALHHGSGAARAVAQGAFAANAPYSARALFGIFSQILDWAEASSVASSELYVFEELHRPHIKRARLNAKVGLSADSMLADESDAADIYGLDVQVTSFDRLATSAGGSGKSPSDTPKIGISLLHGPASTLSPTTPHEFTSEKRTDRYLLQYLQSLPPSHPGYGPRQTIRHALISEPLVQRLSADTLRSFYEALPIAPAAFSTFTSPTLLVPALLTAHEGEADANKALDQNQVNGVTASPFVNPYELVWAVAGVSEDSSTLATTSTLTRKALGAFDPDLRPIPFGTDWLIPGTKPTLTSFGVFSDNGQSLSILFPHLSGSLGRWRLDPVLTASHILPLSTVVMSLLNQPSASASNYSSAVAYYSVMLPESLPLYAEPDLQTIASFLLADRRDLYAVAKTLLQGIVQRAPPGRRALLTAHWSMLFACVVESRLCVRRTWDSISKPEAAGLEWSALGSSGESGNSPAHSHPPSHSAHEEGRTAGHGGIDCSPSPTEVISATKAVTSVTTAIAASAGLTVHPQAEAAQSAAAHAAMAAANVIDASGIAMGQTAGALGRRMSTVGFVSTRRESFSDIFTPVSSTVNAASEVASLSQRSQQQALAVAPVEGVTDDKMQRIAKTKAAAASAIASADAAAASAAVAVTRGSLNGALSPGLLADLNHRCSELTVGTVPHSLLPTGPVTDEELVAAFVLATLEMFQVYRPGADLEEELALSLESQTGQQGISEASVTAAALAADRAALAAAARIGPLLIGGLDTSSAELRRQYITHTLLRVIMYATAQISPSAPSLEAATALLAQRAAYQTLGPDGEAQGNTSTAPGNNSGNVSTQGADSAAGSGEISTSEGHMHELNIPPHIRSALILAFDCLGKGFPLWRRYIPDLLDLIRRLHYFAQVSQYTSVAAAAHRALLQSGRVAPRHYVNCVAMEVVNQKSSSAQRTAAIYSLVALVKKYPTAIGPVLPIAVSVIVRCLDPSHHKLRRDLHQPATAALHVLVTKYPTVTFHQMSQRFAVAACVSSPSSLQHMKDSKDPESGEDYQLHIYDLRTATRWRALSGHKSPITAISFSPSGNILVSYCADEQPPTVRFFNTSHGGLINIFSNQNKCSASYALAPARLPGDDGGQPHIRSAHRLQKLMQVRFEWALVGPKSQEVVTLYREDDTVARFEQK